MSQYAFDAYVPQRQSNTLGIAGFVISLVGLLGSGGLLCPIGLILSLIALGRQPKGFAIAGVILGALGSCGAIVVFLAFGALILAALGIGVLAAFVAMNDPQRVELTLDMSNIQQAVEQYRDRNKVVPAALTELHLSTDTLTDPWGNAYVYTFQDEKPGYDIISNGADGKPGVDDVALSKLGDLWKGYFEVKGDESGGTVSLKMGDKTVVVKGDEKGGRVTIDTGDKTVNIVGGQGNGEIIVTDEHELPSTAPAEDTATSPDEP
jgi:hypothetical protein